MKGEKRFISFTFCAVILLCQLLPLRILHGQTSEYLLKAGFMERFTRFIEWPGDSLMKDTSKPFNILILGENPFGDQLAELLKDVRIQGRRTVVSYQKTPDIQEYYHMVFIAGNMGKSLPYILNSLNTKPVITIGDTEGFGAEGVLINFFIEENKLRFEINQEAVRKSGLKVSHLLLKTAKIL